MKNHTDRITNDPQRVYEITVPQGDRLAYFKLSVDPAKVTQFEHARKQGLNINLADYGTILESYYVEPL